MNYSKTALDTSNLKMAVTGIMIELGIPANIKGYFYLREAIIYKAEHAGTTIPMTKILYPKVAKMFSTTAARVERSIRHAIEVAWDRGDRYSRRGVFGGQVSNPEWKPSNSEFIGAVAERVNLLRSI